ncbi:hypothetical protein DFH06DRAFT_1338724 [Mycena polygramma]|nr:hypothetical protein DFH06DRAFT_1338724 [Mycena polygramma]
MITRSATAEAFAKAHEQSLLERENETNFPFSTNLTMRRSSWSMLRPLRQVDVNAEQAERQQLAAEKERDQWEAKAETVEDKYRKA